MRAPAKQPQEHALSDRAMDNLRFIREAMEEARSFTAVPGWGGVMMGATAIAAAWFAARQPTRPTWLAVWMAEALFAAAIAAATIGWKARRAGLPLLSGAGRKFALGVLPPVGVGAALTVALHLAGMHRLLPGTWMLLYGVAVVAGGTFSIPVVPVLGGCFLSFGLLALFAPEQWADVLMAASFGGLHLGFGLLIARRHGG
jgi:hypothetical protein